MAKNKVEEAKVTNEEITENEELNQEVGNVADEAAVVEDKPKKKLFSGVTVKGVLVGVVATVASVGAGLFLLGRSGNTEECTEESSEANSEE